MERQVNSCGFGGTFDFLYLPIGAEFCARFCAPCRRVLGGFAIDWSPMVKNTHMASVYRFKEA